MVLNKNRIKYICKLSVFLYFYFFSSHIQCEENFNIEALNSSQITSLLQQTEVIRTSKINLFKDSMQVLKSHHKQFNSFQQCYYDYLVAYEHGYDGEHLLSKDMLLAQLNKCNDISITIRIKATLSNLYAISNEYELAIDNLDYSISHLKYINDKNLKHIVYSIASLVYRLLEQDELSLKFSKLLINDSPSKKSLCKALTNKYRISIKQGDNDLDQDKISESIKICEQSDELIYSNLMRLDWMDYTLNNSNLDITSLNNLLNELKNYELEINNTNYANLIIIKNNIYSNIYRKLGNTYEFLKYSKSILENTKSIGNTKQKIEVLNNLIVYYKENNNYIKALEYLEIKNTAEKIQFDAKTAKTMAFQKVKHNNLAKTHEIVYLNTQNNLLALENKLNNKISIIQKLVILILCFLTVFVILWIFKVQKTQSVYKHLSETDSMTGIFNRKGIKDYVEDLLVRAKASDTNIAYAIFDLDYFKSINDKYGHIKGDWVIKNTIIQCQLIQNDKVTFGRIGGEEFAIVMRDSDSDELAVFCEECRKLIANIDTTPTGHDFPVSASFGVTSTVISGYVYSDLMTDADKAMYDAKIAGRNMVVNYKFNTIN
jgi:diguanylate cyclase (GGDEF)-like protein